MVKNKKMLITFAGSLIFILSVFVYGARGEEMPDTGSAPTPYPKAAAFNHQYEFLGENAHTDDGISFKPKPANWKKGKKVKVFWNLTTTEDQRFYPHGVYFRLYVDWNHDGDWDDPGEMVIDSHRDNIKNNGVYKFKEKFIVPDHTYEDPFWARAWVSYGYPSPVYGDVSTSFGEIEDYNLLSYKKGK
ncbi:MAG: GEVED domain-containing protein [Candidatus Brocadia sp.]